MSVCVCEIWAAGAEAGADSGDLILRGHRSWGPVTDVRVSLLNLNNEVSDANTFIHSFSTAVKNGVS